jgi:hypothetical protein
MIFTGMISTGSRDAVIFLLRYEDHLAAIESDGDIA